jgi:hypothetical protein
MQTLICPSILILHTICFGLTSVTENQLIKEAEWTRKIVSQFYQLSWINTIMLTNARFSCYP